MDYKTNSAPANSEAATVIRQTTGMGLTERKSGIKWKQTGDGNIQRLGQDWLEPGIRIARNRRASEQIKMADPEDGVKNVGLRILMDSAKEMKYQTGITLARGISQEIRYKNVLGLNVLMIRI